MLLDQKRTKRIVQAVAILTSVAFAGVIFVVLGLVLFGGGSTPESDLLDAAMERVREEEQKPAAERSPDAYDQLATAFAGDRQFPEAAMAAQTAYALEPRSFERASSAADLELRAGDRPAAIATLERFTRQNPGNAEGFRSLGDLALQSNPGLARLAYQRFLQLQPDSPDAPSIRQSLRQLRSGGGVATAGATP